MASPEAVPPDSWASSPAVRRSMRGNRSRDTTPERALRSALHALGLRFRVDARPVAAIPRRADVVLRADRIAVFLDGCFWHGCPAHFGPPATNADYWTAKIAGNRARDASTTALLEAAGWTVLRVWEHEPTADAARHVVARLVTLRAARAGRATPAGRPPTVRADARFGRRLPPGRVVWRTSSRSVGDPG